MWCFKYYIIFQTFPESNTKWTTIKKDGLMILVLSVVDVMYLFRKCMCDIRQDFCIFVVGILPQCFGLEMKQPSAAIIGGNISWHQCRNTVSTGCCSIWFQKSISNVLPPKCIHIAIHAYIRVHTHHCSWVCTFLFGFLEVLQLIVKISTACQSWESWRMSDLGSWPSLLCNLHLFLPSTALPHHI